MPKKKQEQHLSPFWGLKDVTYRTSAFVSRRRVVANDMKSDKTPAAGSSGIVSVTKIRRNRPSRRRRGADTLYSTPLEY